MGHLINGNGLSQLSNKVSAIKEFPPLKTLRDVRRFLGLIICEPRLSKMLSQLLSYFAYYFIAEIFFVTLHVIVDGL